VQQAILDRVVLAFAITYVSLLVLVFLISSAFTAPIIALTRAAERIGEGDYDQNLADINKARFRDEIGILTDVFSGMVDKVYQREQSLRKQVAELKIEIDETKRQQQVSEIVDSDFFQDLQNKARQMRSRRSQTSPTDSSPNDSTS
jgi:nitrate/nitrite-specific signal transduction histidine kinase